MKASVGFLLIFVIIAGLVALGYFLYRLVNHIITCHNADGKITFKQFRALYEINDYPWFLSDDGADYWADNAGCVRLCFSFLDEMRYIAWRNRKERLKEKNKKNKNFQIALKAMQKDIEKYQERNGL